MIAINSWFTRRVPCDYTPVEGEREAAKGAKDDAKKSESPSSRLPSRLRVRLPSGRTALGRAGQIPLWSAVVLFAALVVAVCVWTYYSTRPETPDGRQSIVFWNSANFGTEVYAALHQFEAENPRYKVIANSSGSRDMTSDAQRLLCAIAGDVPPDLVLFDRFAIGEWAGRNSLTDLDPYLDKQDPADPYRINKHDYYEWALDEARYAPPGSGEAKHLYGIPTTIDIRLLFSNNVLLRQKGIKPPTTWDELRADAKLLTARDPNGEIKQLGFAPNFGNSWLYLYAFQAGGNLLSPDGTKVTLDSDPVVRALRFMTDIYDDAGGYKKVDSFRTGFQSDVHDPFLTGKIALKIDGDWALQTIATWNRDLDFELTPAPMPDDLARQGKPPVTWAGGFSIVIPSTAKQKDGAFKLMQFLLSWKTTHFLMEGDRQAAESQGQLYLPRAQANRVTFDRMQAEYIDGNPTMPATFKRAYTALGQMLPRTLIRPPSPVGQLLWVKHIDAFNAGVSHGDWTGWTDQQKDADIKAKLGAAQDIVQRRLDEVIQPPPPHVVTWGWYFVAYGLLVALPFIALYMAVKRGKKNRTVKPGEVGVAMLFLSPWLVGMICLTAGPILFSIVLSFTRYDMLSPARYVGTDNYKQLLGNDDYMKSLYNTAYMLIRIPLGMAVSLVIAMLLNRRIRGIGGYRTAFYMPTIVPLVAAALLWQFLLNDNYGLINVVIRWVITSPPGHWVEWVVNHVHNFGDKPFHFTTPGWLVDENWVKPSMILMGLWSAGGGMIIWLAGLQSIPTQLYEAATVDGAGPWKQFCNVTVPMLSPYILFNAIMGVIGTMQIFNEAYIIFPDGGQNNSGLFYAFYLFNQAFRFFNMGFASAMAWILFLIVLVLTLVQLYASKKWVHYDRT